MPDSLKALLGHLVALTEGELAQEGEALQVLHAGVGDEGEAGNVEFREEREGGNGFHDRVGEEGAAAE